MPSSPKSATWEAQPHTLAKIRILKAYLHAWFHIMGRSQRGKDILYIDGFAGPGIYTNEAEGSPLAALSALNDVKKGAGEKWSAGKVHIALVEQDRERFNALRIAVEPFAHIPQTFTYLFDSSFEQAMTQLRDTVPQFFRTALPLFAFIDPFGVKGFKFEAVRSLLRSQTSEILVNFDADGVARVLRAGAAASHDAVLTAVYGSDDWKSLNANSPTPVLVREAMTLYLKRLISLPGVRYVFPFEMRTHQDSINYYLVFASQHHRGLEKMKDAMRKVDITGAYQFCDASHNQGRLFRFDDLEPYANMLAARFSGQTASFNEVRDFVLLETPFSTPNAVLKALEQSGTLVVASRNPSRRRGTFKPEDMVSLTFNRGAP